MDADLKEILWRQFGAAIDMLENAITASPEELWNTKSNFWYIGFHTIFYLDYYLSDPETFSPPPPFGITEFDPSGKLPERVYTKAELLSYVEFCRKKCHDLIAGLTTEHAAKRFINPYRNYSTMEILIYNMRHVQHHTAQLNLLLRQQVNDAPKWVSQTKTPL